MLCLVFVHFNLLISIYSLLDTEDTVWCKGKKSKQSQGFILRAYSLVGEGGSGSQMGSNKFFALHDLLQAL